MKIKMNGLAMGLDAVGMILVLCILMSGGLIAANSLLDMAKTSQARSETAAIAAAISQYHYEIGEYPTALNELTTAGGGDNSQYGPWLKKVNKDPWNKDYQYAHNDDGFVIYSYGADGKNDGSNPENGIANDDIGFSGK